MLKFSEYSYIFVCSVSPVSRESIADSEQGWAADSALSDHGIGGLIPTSSDDGCSGSVRDVSAEMGVDSAFFGNVYTPRTGVEVESDNELDTVSITSCSSVSPGEARTILSHLIIAVQLVCLTNYRHSHNGPRMRPRIPKPGAPTNFSPKLARWRRWSR